MSQTLENRSLLAGALSMEFSECSIAAADLSMKAQYLLAEKPEQKSFYVVDGRQQVQKVLYRELTFSGSTTEKGFRLNGLPTRLVLACEVPKKIPNSTEQKKKRFFSGSSSKETKPDPEPAPIPDPFLAVTIGEKALLPIASFAKRTNGNCSYVQLGQEMTDDNFYVTTGDDASNRQSLIEAFRTIFKNSSESNRLIVPDPDAEANQQIQAFIDLQTETQRKKLESVYESQLVEALLDKLNSQEAGVVSLLPVVKGCDSVRQDYRVFTILGPTVIEGFRVELAVAAPLMSPSDIELVAITHDNLSVSVARLSQNLAEIEFINTTKTGGLVKELSAALLNRKFSSGWAPKQQRYSKPKEPKLVYLAEERVISVVPNAFQKGTLQKSTFESFERFFAYPDSNTPELETLFSRKVNYLKAVADYLALDDQKKVIDLLGALNVADTLKMNLGEIRQIDHLLLRQVGKLALNGQLSKVIKDMQLGKTSGDALISAEATAEDKAYHLVISGRPVSMADSPMQPLVDIWLKSTERNLGLQGVMAKESHVEELAETLLDMRSDNAVY